MKLSENENELIRQAVREAEKSTSGEIVPMIVRSTEPWFELYAAFLLAGIGAGSLAFWAMDRWALFGSWHSPLELLELQAFGLVAGAVLSLFSPLRRAMLPAAVRDAAVRRAAESAFIRNGLTETRDRTGILVFIALFEHEVLILADRGIHQKLGDTYWKQHADKIAGSVRENRFTEQLCDSIAAMGTQLAQHFPRKSDDTNELPDQPQGS